MLLLKPARQMPLLKLLKKVLAMFPNLPNWVAMTLAVLTALVVTLATLTWALILVTSAMLLVIVDRLILEMLAVPKKVKSIWVAMQNWVTQVKQKLALTKV
ncbi:hypothetical protein D3C85_929930 [compost metagenome]